MRCQIFSDIHAEGYTNNVDLLWEVVTPSAPIAIVAGDIDTRNYEATCNNIAKKFEHVIVLLGNHEFYHRDIGWRPNKSALADNVHFLDRSTVEIDGVTFVGATLWSDFRNSDWYVINAAKDLINDFHVISNSEAGAKFHPNHAVELFNKDYGYLKQVIENNRGKKLCVITHFMPSFECINPYWKKHGGLANHYFSANCDSLINICEPGTVWVSGHTHSPYDFMLGDTRMVCNPLGYALGKERNNQNNPYTDLVIEI